MLQELNALIQLGLHVIRIKGDENHIIPFLPVLKKLIIKSPPSAFKNTGFDKMPMKSSSNPGMLFKRQVTRHQQGETA